MANFIVNWLTWLVTRVAWLLADLFGWSFATAFLPPTLLKGKVAIVTGANAGIGLEATKALLRVSRHLHWPDRCNCNTGRFTSWHHAMAHRADAKFAMKGAHSMHCNDGCVLHACTAVRLACN